MRKILTLALAASLTFACNEKPAEVDYTQLTDEERLEIAKEFTKNTILVDGHMDLPYRMYNQGNTMTGEVYDFINRQEAGNIDYVRAREGGMDAPFMAIYIPAGYQESGGAKALADTLIMMVERLASTWPDKIALAKSPEEIEENFKKGLLSLPMGIENAAAIEDDLSNVAYFFDKGIRYMTLTHGKDNLVGDSSYDDAETHGGLSEFGKDVVKEMNRLGMIIDVSHITDKTFFDVAELSTAPIVATHSSVRNFTPGFERNVSDEVIQKIAEKDGMVMITFGGSFLDQAYSEKNTANRTHIQEWLEENNLNRRDSAAQEYISSYTAANKPTVHVSKVAEHIDHVVKLVGIDHVGLGSDFDGVGDSLPEGLKDASMYPNLIAELMKLGYSNEDLEKICYKNFFRVWKAVEAIAE
ncbi:Zn-dependent dipeptidase, microsomal dipeptidase [Belliella baltica DSM 15883]|uniref:Zn-dependent dipeptidase, microsomal dipeptidase n=1 Tax=Belliella baltica (strain DSM 15883 / CIP 108006 / LMG 21964 / BA134) TaxID=866536 RepID=I3Z292_BELBD|nr:dipeptidase [Belliella baltica]AFL83360.1 Zn-dependent dipeptidase, microsomal dipeptidase [Belliella baltica DSM 15883]